MVEHNIQIGILAIDIFREQMLKKIADAVEMSLPVSKTEIEQAEIVKEHFKFFLAKANIFSSQLEKIIEWVDNEEVTNDQILENRGQIYQAKNNLHNKFEDLKKVTGEALTKINFFSQDPSFKKLIGAFEDTFAKIEKTTSKILETLFDWDGEDFKEEIKSLSEEVLKELESLVDIIKDRVFNHIDDNFLSGKWKEKERKELQNDVQKQASRLRALAYEYLDALDTIRKKC